MTPPRLLVLSCTPPGPQGVGGIILRDLFALLPADRLVGFFPVGDPSSACMPAELRGVPAVFASVRHETAAPSHLGLPGRTWNGLRNALAFRRHVRSLTQQAVALGRQHQSDAVWAILDAPTSIALAEPVARALGKPLLSLVWDDADHLAASLALDRLSRSTMLRHRDRALQASVRCAVICEAMRRRYADRWGTVGVVLRHGLARQNLLPVRRSANCAPVFSLAFAGTMSAPCAFEALLAALDWCDWRIAGRDIELRLIGPRFDMRSSKPALFRSYGWRSLPDTISILADADALYLPQPFSVARRNLAVLSYPTKLTTYLAAGRPILLHAPPYASLSQYQQQQPLGLHCDSTDPPAIQAVLQQLISEPQVYGKAAADARQAYEADFTHERFRSNFAALLGVSVSDLVGSGTET